MGQKQKKNMLFYYPLRKKLYIWIFGQNMEMVTLNPSKMGTNYNLRGASRAEIRVKEKEIGKNYDFEFHFF